MPQPRGKPADAITGPRFLSAWWVPDAAIAALRVAVALLMILHGIQEHFGVLLAAAEPWRGVPAPFSDRWLAATIELAGGALLAAGAFTRSAAIGLASLVVLGYFAPLQARGHWNLSGAELIALQVAILLLFAVIGPGMFSIDALRAIRRRPRPSGPTVSISPWIRRQYRHRELTR
jgi:putative oxidoreductase